MTTLKIYLVDQDQEAVVKQFLEELHVEYVISSEQDETDYLESSDEMVAHLDKAAKQEQNGEGVKISLDQIWK